MAFGKCDVTSVAVVAAFFKQTVVCVFVAEFLALCPTGIGTTGDGRGNVIHKLKPDNLETKLLFFFPADMFSGLLFLQILMSVPSTLTSVRTEYVRTC